VIREEAKEEDDSKGSEMEGWEVPMWFRKRVEEKGVRK
jgi:hypothetical protein